MFLQECDKDFFDEDLHSSFLDYDHKFKMKGENKEGVATLFRKDRFK
jgi:hypothetical protein